jgi:hypothetical protein
MGEIKSTLDLAMERTKKISISQEEKEEIKRKEILQKVTGLSNRYREGRLSLNEIQKEIERMDGKTEKTVKEALLSQWIDALSLGDEDERLLKGVESLKNQEVDDVRQKLHRLIIEYQREKEKVKQDVRTQLIKALRKEGISGSAVEPKIEGTELWEKELKKLDDHYRVKLEEIKDQLRGL